MTAIAHDTFAIVSRMKKTDIQLVEAIKYFVDNNLKKPILVKDLCIKFCINRNKLQNGFRYLFGQTIHSYILEQKMFHAAERLKSTDDAIKAIALEYGYNPSNFNTKFKRQFKCSPVQFRNKEKMG